MKNLLLPAALVATLMLAGCVTFQRACADGPTAVALLNEVKSKLAGFECDVGINAQKLLDFVGTPALVDKWAESCGDLKENALAEIDRYMPKILVAWKALSMVCTLVEIAPSDPLASVSRPGGAETITVKVETDDGPVTFVVPVERGER